MYVKKFKCAIFIATIFTHFQQIKKLSGIVWPSVTREEPATRVFTINIIFNRFYLNWN